MLPSNATKLNTATTDTKEHICLVHKCKNKNLVLPKVCVLPHLHKKGLSEVLVVHRGAEAGVCICVCTQLLTCSDWIIKHHFNHNTLRKSTRLSMSSMNMKQAPCIGILKCMHFADMGCAYFYCWQRTYSYLQTIIDAKDIQKLTAKLDILPVFLTLLASETKWTLIIVPCSDAVAMYIPLDERTVAANGERWASICNPMEY